MGLEGMEGASIATHRDVQLPADLAEDRAIAGRSRGALRMSRIAGDPAAQVQKTWPRNACMPGTGSAECEEPQVLQHVV